MKYLLVFIAGFFLGCIIERIRFRVAWKRHLNRRRNNDLKEIVFTNEAFALHILELLRQCIKEYGFVSVGEYYELSGHDYEFTDFNYGWKNLDRAYVLRSMGDKDGFVLQFPYVEKKEEKYEK